MRPVVTSLLRHDAWCKTAPCWLPTTMSSCFSWCTLLFPWKSRNAKTKSEVSNEYKIRWCKLLDNYLRQDLLENEQALVPTTKECTTVENRVTETNSKAAVRGLLFILPSLWRTSASQELPENELVAIVSATKECTSVKERVMETNSKAAVREDLFFSSHLSDAHNPGIVWKPPGDHSFNSKLYHGNRETGLNVVTVCSISHTSPTDKRGNWNYVENYWTMRGMYDSA